MASRLLRAAFSAAVLSSPLLLAQAPHTPAPGEQQEGEELAGPVIPDSWQAAFDWRSIGPATMSGRITDLAFDPSDSSTWYAATAAGGLLKTTNDGTTFEHLFQHEAVCSIGAVDVAPSNTEHVWVGTGENNPRNSVSWGNGVYKSLNGGKTWQHVGLEESFQIGDIIVHPDDEDTVFVAALGRLWGENEQRGLFKTSDGGETWEKILYVDAGTGALDICMHPTDPNTLLVATYERQRDEFCTNDPDKKWGPGGGLWRSTDGGATFERITAGLPQSSFGRIGLDWYQADPDVVFMVLEAESLSQVPENAAYCGLVGTDVEVGARLSEVTADSPAAAAGLEVGDIVVEVAGDRVHSWSDLQKAIGRRLAGDTAAFVVARDGEDVELELTFSTRPEEEEDEEQEQEASGKPSEPERPFSAYLGGQQQNVQDQQGPDGHEYGGTYRSDDAGKTWRRINSLNPRPMYFSVIRVDPSDDQHLYVCGISLHRSKDGGKTFTSDGHGRGVHVDHHALWIDPKDGRHIVLGNDGGIYVTRDRMENWDHLNHFAIGQFYHVTTDATRNYKVYGGLQDNGTWGGPSRVRHGAGPTNQDWIRVGGGDGFICRVDAEDPDQIYYESQNGGLGARNLRTGERSSPRPRAPKGTRYRWNWMTPFILSSHNSQIYYSAGNHVFRSLKKGADSQPISPDITRTERGSATALAESPRDANIIWVGTDDGALWRTNDGGHSWDDLFEGRTIEGEEQLREPGPVAVAGVASEANGQADAEAGGLQAAAREAASGRGDEASEHPLAGEWEGQAHGEDLADGEGAFELSVEIGDRDVVTGWLACQIGEGELSRGKWNPHTRALTFRWVGDLAVLDFDGELSTQGLLSGLITAGDELELSFEARRTRVSPARTVAIEQTEESPEDEVPGTTEQHQQDAVAADETPDEAPVPTLGDLVPDPHRVSAIVLSRHADDRVYVAFDGHRTNSDHPHAFASDDAGATWHTLTANLPASAGSVRTLEEDLKNPSLLYLGTEFGFWVSLDRGAHWTRLHGDGLPTVPVHAIAQPPAVDEIVAGTHGRSLWILDVSALRQMSPETLKSRGQLFKPAPAVRWRSMPGRGSGGPREFVGENGSSGASITYLVGEGARGVSLRITDLQGETVRELDASSEAGLHSVRWDLRKAAPEGASRWRRSPSVSPGTYIVELTINSTTSRVELEVELDPEHSEDATWLEFEELEDEVHEGEDGEPSLPVVR